MLDQLPSSLRAVVERFILEHDLKVMSASAMSGRCYDVSRELAACIDEHASDYVIADATIMQIWRDEPVPDALAGNDMAPGHFVVRALWADLEEGEEVEVVIDLTAAQFPELGWTAPRIAILS